MRPGGIRLTRSLWIALVCYLLIGVGLVLFAFPDDPFARTLAFVGLAILGGGAAIDISFHAEESAEPVKISKRSHRIVRRSVLFIVFFFFSFFWIPFLGVLHHRLSGLFFLWPQSTLAPSGLAHACLDDPRYLEGTAIYVVLAFWFLVASLYGIATERRSLKFAALLAYPVMIVLVVAANFALHLAGFVACYDWP